MAEFLDVLQVKDGIIDFGQDQDEFQELGRGVTIRNAALFIRLGSHFQLSGHGAVARCHEEGKATLQTAYDPIVFPIISDIDWIRDTLYNQTRSLGFLKKKIGEEAHFTSENDFATQRWYQPWEGLLQDAQNTTQLVFRSSPQPIYASKGALPSKYIWPEPKPPGPAFKL